MAGSMNPRIEEVQRLADVEDKLRREKEQCETLEQQILALARQTQSLVSQGPGPSPFQSDAPQPSSEYAAPQHATSSAALQQQARQIMPSRVQPPAVPPPPPPGSAPPTAARRQQLEGTTASIAATNGAASRSQYPAAAESGSASRGAPRSSSKPRVLSSMYRGAGGTKGRSGSASASRGAVMTSWSQAPRFRDEKTWVPGPGKYNAEHGQASFEPFQERPQGTDADYDGAKGHTWQQHGKKFPGDLRGSSGDLEDEGTGESSMAMVTSAGAGAAGSTSRSASPRRGGGGETQQLLDASLRRERQLKRELIVAQRKLGEQMADVSQYQSQQRTLNQKLQQRLTSKTSSLDSARSRLRAWKKSLAEIEPAATELIEAIDRARGVFIARGEDALFRSIRGIGSRLDAALTEAQPLADDGGTVATSTVMGQSKGYESWSTLPPQMREEEEESMGAAPGPVDGTRLAGGLRDSVPVPPPPASPDGGIMAFAQRTRRMSMMHDQQLKDAKGRSSQQAELVAAFGRGAGHGRSVTPGGSVPTPAAMQTIAASTAGHGPGSSVSSPGRKGRRGSVGPHDVMVRRIGAADQTVKAYLDESPVKAKESTIDEKLRNIFSYYAMYGQRLGTGETLSRSQFYKMIRDCRVLDNTHVSHSDIDIVVAREQRRAGETGRMSYETFIQALTSVSARKYRDLDPARQKEAEADPNFESQALRRLLKDFVLPIYEGLKKSATFVYDVVREGSAEPLARFNEQFLTQDTIGFFQDFDDAFQSLFMRYAMLQEPGKHHGAVAGTAAGLNSPSGLNLVTSGAASLGLDASTPTDEGALKQRHEAWQQVLQSHHRMTRYAFYKFCGDMKIMPDMLTRPQLTSIFREANRGLAHDDSPDTLCYPEFVELVALIANHQYSYADAKERGGSGALPTLVSKVQYLIFIMHEKGAKFFGDENRLVRHTLRVVKERLRSSHREKVEAASGEQAQKMKKVANVLMESVFL